MSNAGVYLIWANIDIQSHANLVEPDILSKVLHAKGKFPDVAQLSSVFNMFMSMIFLLHVVSLQFSALS